MRVAMVLFLVLAIFGVGLALLFRSPPRPEPAPRLPPAGAWTEARQHLSPVVMPAGWLAIDRKVAPGFPAVLARPFGDGLIEVVEGADGLVDVDQLAEWRLDAGEVFETAERNLHSGTWSFEKVDGGLVLATFDDERSATAVLTWPKAFEGVPHQGDLLVGFCGTSAVVADTANAESVSTLMECITADGKHIREDGDPELIELNGRVLTPRGDSWAEWKPDGQWALPYKTMREHGDDVERRRAAP